MSIKPKKCCAIGTYECQVPMPLNGRIQSIDYCIADIVAALNAANIETKMSCCGHGNEGIAVICLSDGRELRVAGHTPKLDSFNENNAVIAAYKEKQHG